MYRSRYLLLDRERGRFLVRVPRLEQRAGFWFLCVDPQVAPAANPWYRKAGYP
jgi:hypothetical protein